MMISVILPFYNENGTIQKTIDCLKSQTTLPAEVLFVDSGSNDDTAQIIKDNINTTQEFSLILMYSGKMSPSSSINLGIKSAKHNMVMYIDCGLHIPENWIESQINKYQDSSSDLISGKIFTKGINNIDKSFIAHTYGYMNSTPCLTGSLFDRNIIHKTGEFIENVRAGYDTHFIKKIKNNKLSRVINNVNLEYYGTNYADNFLKGFKKVALYSKSSSLIESDNKPIYYFVFVLLGLISIKIDLFCLFVLLYIILRGLLFPIYKSDTLQLFKEIKLILILPLTAVVYDMARMVGYLESYTINHET